jgi:hypothetical protein
LLISSDFLASNAFHSEVEQALQHHRVGLSHVIPLLLRPVDWELAPFAHLQVLPRNGIPVTKWGNRDEAFADIAKGVRLAIEQWNGFALRLLQRSPTLEPSYLFLSSARKDLPLLNRLKEDLRDIGGMIKEQDDKASQTGSFDEDAKKDVHEAVSSASAVILVATPHIRRSRSIKQELHIAQMYQRSIYLFWMQGDHLMEVMPTGYDHLPSIDARGRRYETALQDLIQALDRQERTHFPGSPALPVLREAFWKTLSQEIGDTS